jgi:AcrR family transcriptional regulator
MRVFAERGTGSSVIQEVIAHAQVAQGTFYNYFRTNEELLVAVSEELSNELLALIEAVVGDFVDPAKRIASGVRLYLHTAREYTLFAKFVAASGLHAAGPSSLIYEYLPPDIAAGQQTGRFADMPTEVALDLIAGTSLAAVLRLSSDEAPADYPEKTVAAILRGLGVPGAQASRLVRIELPRIQPAADSLLARARPTV